MNVYDERLEPTYNETVSIESYYEVQAESEKEHNMRIDAETKLEELVSTIFEIGNREDTNISKELAEIIEYIHKEKLDEKVLSKK